MGMSSSQARLLTITSRMHDLEYRSQQLANVKMSLSRQSERVSEDYLAALDKQYLQVKVMNNGASAAQFIDATYNSMCQYNPDIFKYQYLLTDYASGAVYVDQKTREAYEAASGDRNTFILSMMGVDNPDAGWSRSDDKPFSPTEEAIIKDMQSDPDKYGLTEEQLQDFNAQYEDVANAENAQLFLDKFKINVLQTIVTNAGESYDERAAAWYGNIFDRIQASGGAMLDLPEGKENDNVWLTNMIQGGHIVLDKYGESKSNPEWESVTLATDTNLDEDPNEDDIKKAEVIYETETKKINNKEKRIDNELSMINTEHEALKTEHDSIKNIIKDNIDKTFNLFS